MAWVQRTLADVTSWRTALYLVLRLPVAVLGLVAGVGLPALCAWLIGANVWVLTTQSAERTAALSLAVPVTLTMDLPERPDEDIERVAYFCVGELLTNIAKHSGAGSATVRVLAVHGELRITVEDGRRGGALIGSGSGLLGVQDRLAAVDGRLDVRRPKGGPTSVEVILPARI